MARVSSAHVFQRSYRYRHGRVALFIVPQQVLVPDARSSPLNGDALCRSLSRAKLEARRVAGDAFVSYNSRQDGTESGKPGVHYCGRIRPEWQGVCP